MRKLIAQTPIATLAVLAGLMTALLLAFVPICVRLSEVGPIATGFYRFFLSFPFLISWMVFDHMREPNAKVPKTKRDYFLMWGAGAFLALDLIFWHSAMLHTSVVNAMLLSNLTPIFVSLGSWIIFKQKLTWTLILAIIAATIGSIILVGGTFSLNTGHAYGDMLAFISCLFFSAFLVSVQALRQHFRSPTIMAWGAIPTMYILALVALISGENIIPHSLHGWSVLFFMALVIHILGQGLLTFSMAHISATISSLLMSMAPVFSAFLAWIFFQERLSSAQLLGGSIVLAGVFIARIPQAKERKPD
ncbi:MAG: hypothetical protein C0514_01850 [Candidatus Puniceispirillum sp.]|nr:hypothetical protein [Candidatus Puniceispirillum sp.]MCA0370560.1 DMT family transporter [Pseudomonadota bacterium]